MVRHVLVLPAGDKGWRRVKRLAQAHSLSANCQKSFRHHAQNWASKAVGHMCLVSANKLGGFLHSGGCEQVMQLLRSCGWHTAQ